MTIYLATIFFILGITMGSFYNVVGYRLPKGESLMFPPSHCTNCNHRLTPLELVPVFSYVFLGGKCKHCKQKISPFYPIFELCSGILFMVSYLIFGLTLECLLSITFISMILIIIISDYQSMIINDSVLITFSILLIIELYFIKGINGVGISIFNGIISFVVMLLIKLLGDFIFKKESMGGGDIKLMLIFGFVLGYKMALFSIVFGAIIGLPISILVLYIKKNRVVPFGPFLTMAALNIYLLGITYESFINLLIK